VLGDRVTVVHAVRAEFAWLVAVTVTVCCDGMLGGAVYRPALETVPIWGSSDQFTALFDLVGHGGRKLLGLGGRQGRSEGRYRDIALADLD